MGNSKTTSPRKTSKSTTTQNNALAAKQTTFAIGDVVLCPSLSMAPFTLEADPYGKRDELTITYDGSYHYYNAQGYFVSSKDTETGAHQTSLFHDTPANRQAVATLYGNAIPAPSRHRKTIDITGPDDDEVVLMSSFDLGDFASDMQGAAGLISDIGKLLALIQHEQINASTTISMARITHDATDRWESILRKSVKNINATLALNTNLTGA